MTRLPNYIEGSNPCRLAGPPIAKICIRCGNRKDLSFFPKMGRKCKQCKNELGRIFYSALDPETKRTKYGLYASSAIGKAKKKRHYAKLRHDILVHYGRGLIACSCCGEKEEHFLSLDHITPFKDNRSGPRGGRTLYQWLRKRNYPEGFRILCFNCNHGRHLNGGLCPHEELKNYEQVA